MLEAGNDGKVVAETDEMMNQLLPGFAWVYGPGAAGYGEPGRSLTLSGEGVSHRQLLAVYWASRAPRLDGWTFYASRQPSPPEIIENHAHGFRRAGTEPAGVLVDPGD